MKTRLLLTTALLISGMAKAQVTNPDVLNNRTENTRASIRTSIDDLRNASGVTSEEHGDLEIQLKSFTQKVEAGLNKYSQDYETKVIRPVKLMVQDYNNVKLSQVYTPDEKKALLEDIYNRMVVTAASLSKNIQAKSMKELIALSGFRVEGCEKVEESKKNTCWNPCLQNAQIINLFNEFPANYAFLVPVVDVYNLSVDLAQILPFYQAYSSCYSRGCQTLWHLTLVKYKALLEKLNTEFSLTIDQNRTIIFNPSGDASLIYMARAIDWGFNYFSDKELPFNVDKKSMDLLDEVLQKVNTARDLSECKAEMQRLIPLLCHESDDLCQSKTVRNVLKTKVTDILLPELQTQIDLLSEEIKKLNNTKEELIAKRSHIREGKDKWYKITDQINVVSTQLTKLSNQISAIKQSNLSRRQSCLD